jgi:hypothetical protein
MNLLRDSSVSTQIKEQTFAQSSSSAFEERRGLQAFYSWPALLALMFTVPTSANVEITQPLVSMNQTCISMRWRSEREEESLGTEIYAPFHAHRWTEIGPLRIPIARHIRAKMVFLGRLRLLPFTEGI